MIFNEGIKDNASFALIDKANEDLFHAIKDIIIGGLSTVLAQIAKTGETHIIYSHEKLYQKIMGLNAKILKTFHCHECKHIFAESRALCIYKITQHQIHCCECHIIFKDS